MMNNIQIGLLIIMITSHFQLASLNVSCLCDCKTQIEYSSGLFWTLYSSDTVAVIKNEHAI